MHIFDIDISYFKSNAEKLVNLDNQKLPFLVFFKGCNLFTFKFVYHYWWTNFEKTVNLFLISVKAYGELNWMKNKLTWELLVYMTNIKFIWKLLNNFGNTEYMDMISSQSLSFMHLCRE
jgi:hypothetical protein